MAKKKEEDNSNTDQDQDESTENEKEGQNLLGAPTFAPLENGRFKCVETGHELPAHSRESYSTSKHCRSGLIDFALAHNKPPLNMFTHDPFNRSKLICKLTGVTINKSESHIWKHINGKRFLNMLEKKEAEKEISNGTAEKQSEDNEVKKKKKKEKDVEVKKKEKKAEKKVEEIVSEMRDSEGKDSDLEEEAGFWIPPVGQRWDHDDGGDRWGSDSESEPENSGADEEVPGTEEDNRETGELSKRTKRMSLEIGPSSFASRKKKKKTDNTQ